MVKYIPRQKDIVMVDLDPVKGHEQGRFRPAIVVSNDVFNKYTNLVLLCPISTNTKYFPTHYNLEDTHKIKGSVFIEHIRSIDYDNRKFIFVEKASDNDFLSVLMLLESCFNQNDLLL